MQCRPLLAVLLALAALPALAQAPHASEHQHEKSGRTKLLEAGAELLQRETPLGQVHAHVCGFHFYSGEPQRQVIAHHYCSHLSEDLMQCLIYDSEKKNARLIGIEYIISAKLFATLAAEEKKLWHSHRYEVKSGQLIAPRLPEVAEKELMQDLVGTYGKTIHTWQYDKHPDLPLGAPQLMMGFTADGQGQQELIAARDAGYRISTAEKRKARTSLPEPKVDPAADGGQQPPVQLQFLPVPTADRVQ